MKLLIVDDEVQIRTGLCEGIDWFEIGINEVYSAQDGIEAMEIFLEQLPEIVITDIKMPAMDGLELSKKIREISTQTRIIILSGYSEFEYAKKALQIGVVEYELKPVNIDNLIQMVTNTIKDIEKSKMEEEKSREYKQSHKEKLFDDIINGVVVEKETINKVMSEYYKVGEKELVVCLLLEIDNFTLNNKGKTSSYTVTKAIEENISAINGVILCVMENHIPILAKFSQAGIINGAYKFFCNDFFNKINSSLSKLELSISIGVSDPGYTANLSQMYVQVNNALQQKLYRGQMSLNYFSESKNGSDNSFYSKEYDSRLNKLEESIIGFKIDSIEETLLDLFNNLKAQECSENDIVKNMCFDLKNLLIRTIKRMGIDFDGLFGSNLRYFDEVGRLETIDNYYTWLWNIYYLVIQGLSDLNNVKHNPLIIKAAEYIKKNYYMDLTIEVLSEYVQKSPNYFSHLFKKEFGMSFSEYLNSVRISEAKALLKSSNLLTYEISDKVGFQYYKHFALVFKKYTGYSPSEYRLK